MFSNIFNIILVFRICFAVLVTSVCFRYIAHVAMRPPRLFLSHITNATNVILQAVGRAGTHIIWLAAGLIPAV